VSYRICLLWKNFAHSSFRFLLARLHLDSLLDKNTKKKILSTLAKLPRGSEALDEAYNDAIRRIEGQLPGNFTLAKSVLSWITYAERPLTTRELCHALAVEVGESELDPDNIPDVQDMVSVCAGLVAVDEESNIIRFVHYTTQEYFERIRETWNPRAQQDIASTCLTYLSFDPFRSGSSSNNKELKRRLVENVFLDYAARNWGWHARTVQEQVYDLALHFLQDDDLVSCAAQIMFVPEYKYKVRRGYSQRFIKQVTGLHLLVEFGLLYLLQKLLSEKSTKINVVVDSKDNHGRTALTWAATKGHEAVVRLLLARDDVAADSKSNDGQTPLRWAAANGHEAVVQLLLLRGDVTVDSKDNYGRTPLSWAAGEGREGVVRLLLPRDDVAADSKDSNGWTPLMWAAKQGHEDVVRLLLALDDVAADSKSNDGQTPLSLAAEGGNQGVVQLLLARDDVEINSEDDMGWTSLSYALKGGHETVVQLLLARDDVTADSKDVSGRRPLYSAMAAWSDDEATIFDDEGDGSHTDTYESSNIIENRNLEERSRERQVSTQSEVNPALLGFERLTEKLFKTPPSLDPIHTGIGPPPNAYPATLTELGTPMWIIKKAKLFCTHFSDFVLLDKSQDSENSFTNSMKNAVERYLGATVVWWPLSTVRKQVKPHKNRISWMCVSRFEKPTHAFELS
jgi:ankyrin repeat protein